MSGIAVLLVLGVAPTAGLLLAASVLDRHASSARCEDMATRASRALSSGLSLACALSFPAGLIGGLMGTFSEDVLVYLLYAWALGNVMAVARFISAFRRVRRVTLDSPSPNSTRNDEARMSTSPLSESPIDEAAPPADGEPTPSHPSLGDGLRGQAGIRWLLLAGALVTAACAFHLLRTAWPFMHVALQFLTLVGGSLGVFAAGTFAKERLHLPMAGSGLLLLFVSLVPVLTFGAARLEDADGLALTASPLGLLSLGVGILALFVGCRRALESVLSYSGRSLSVALGVLATAPPLLPKLIELTGLSGQGGSLLYVVTAATLGGVLALGCRQVNRSLFHRDRREGVERSLSLVPFLLLGALYIASLVSLQLAMGLGRLELAFVALPVAILGMSFVATGEEYLRALAKADGHAPKAWPARSVALLALGWSLGVVALPLSLLDATHQCAALVFLLVSARLLSWSYHWRSPVAHVCGIAVAVVGYHFIPAVTGQLTTMIREGFTEATQLAERSPGLWSFGHLPFLIALIGMAVFMRRGKFSRVMQDSHQAFLCIHAVALCVVAMVDLNAARLFFPVGLLATLSAAFLCRRATMLTLSWVPFSLLTLTWSSHLLSERTLLAQGPVLLLGTLSLVLAVATPWLVKIAEPHLGDDSRNDIRDAILTPACFVALGLVINGVLTLARNAAHGIEGQALLIVGGVLGLAVGARLRSTSLLAASVLPTAIGLQLLASTSDFGFEQPAQLLTMLVFTACWLAHRLRFVPETKALVRAVASTGVVVHAVLGMFWLAKAMVTESSAALEAGFLLLLAVAMAERGIATRDRRATGLAGLAFASWLPIQCWAFGLFTSNVAGLSIAGVALVLLVAGVWALERKDLLQLLVGRDLAADPGELNELLSEPLRDLLQLWMGFALATCLCVSGQPAFLLSVLLLAVASLARAAGDRPFADLLVSPMMSLLCAFQGLALLAQPASGILLLDVLDRGLEILHVTALLGLAWLLHADFWQHRRPLSQSVKVARIGVEAGLVWLFVVAAVDGPALADSAHVMAIIAAVGLALRRVVMGLRGTPGIHGGMLLQAWLGLAVLQAVCAGFIVFGNGRSPYFVLAAAFAEFGLAALFLRGPLGKAFARPAQAMAALLPTVAGLLAIYRTATYLIGTAPANPAWFSVLPLFLVSLTYLLLSSALPQRVLSRCSCALWLNFALIGTVLTMGELDLAFACLGPGVALLALSYLLREEAGPEWTRRFFSAGACFVYATPLVGMRNDITWEWLSMMLVLTTLFGGFSFVIRSKTLLTVSTAALVVDLVCSIVLLHDQRTLLALAGVLFGLGLMGLAAFLEYRREGLLQQLRVFGKELEAWH